MSDSTMGTMFKRIYAKPKAEEKEFARVLKEYNDFRIKQIEEMKRVTFDSLTEEEKKKVMILSQYYSWGEKEDLDLGASMLKAGYIDVICEPIKIV